MFLIEWCGFIICFYKYVWINIFFTNNQPSNIDKMSFNIVYKNKINNASVVLDYLLFERLTMPELHEWTKLFNYHYGWLGY